MITMSFSHFKCPCIRSHISPMHRSKQHFLARLFYSLPSVGPALNVHQLIFTILKVHTLLAGFYLQLPVVESGSFDFPRKGRKFFTKLWGYKVFGRFA